MQFFYKTKNIVSMNISNCDGFGLIHRVIKLVEATNLEHGSQDGADGGDTELNGGGGSEREDFRYILRRGLYPRVPYPSVPLIARPKGYPTL